MIEIEKGIPIPSDIGTGRPSKYPWKAMEIGDSFVFEGPPSNIYTQASRAGSKYGKKYVCHRIDGNSCRVWRIA